MPGRNLTRLEAEERARLVTVDCYDVTIDLTSQAETFPSTTVIRFDCSEPGATTFLDLIADKVRRVELNGVELDVEAVFADSRIQLPNLQAHNQVVVVADASYSHTGEGLHRFTDPVDSRSYVYTQCEVADARRIFATFEQPDLKSRFVFHIIAPDDWTVISNQPTPQAVPVPTSDARPGPTPGVARWDFAPTPIMSCYLIAVIAGPYARWDDTYISTDQRRIPMGAFVRQSMAEFFDAAEIFDVTRRGFEFYETAFAVPYPYEKYDQAFVPQYNAGAMENIGAVTLTEERYVFRSKPVDALIEVRAGTILHEQAHMWFGDLVTMKWWNDLWLNESFAEFMSYLAMASNTRWTTAWTDFQTSRKLVGYQQDQLPTTHPIVADIRDLADVEVNFDMITYAKGASVLRQLSAWVGQDKFLEGVHNYLVKYAGGNATMQDFLAEVAAASGRELAQWSKLWLEEAGVTKLRPVVVEGAGVYESVAVAQEIPALYQRFASVPHRDLPPIEVRPSLRPHHIAIAGYRFDDTTMTQVWRCESDIDGAMTEIPAASGQVIADLLMINDSDLTYAKVRLDDRSRRRLPEVLTSVDDPLIRALLWGSLWDEVRDCELPARAYVDLVLGAIGQETSSTTIMGLLRRLKQALQLYVGHQHRPAAIENAAERLMALALAAEPGSDQQTQFFRSFAGLAEKQTHLDHVAAVLDGADQLPGLIVGADLRWELLTDLVGAGERAQSEIAAELARDDTMSGHEKAAGALAAIPTPQAKQQAWQTGVFDESVSNATQRNILQGFTAVHDVSLLRGFAAEYFAQIEQIWATRSREMAQNIVQMLYPLRLVDDPKIDLLAMTDQWLDQQGARQPALRRLILAARQELICAQAAQQADAS